MLPATVKRHRFTVREYHTMVEAGLLSEDDRVELVDGEIVEMTPIGTRHLACVVALNHLLVDAADGRYFVSVQNPIILNEDNEPQPDLSLLKTRPEPTGELPGPQDVLLVIEVSDTTLGYDRGVKLPRYVHNGIPEVWIVDLQSQLVEIYSEPSSEGYRASRTANVGDPARAATIDLELPTEEIFG